MDGTVTRRALMFAAVAAAAATITEGDTMARQREPKTATPMCSWGYPAWTHQPPAPPTPPTPGIPAGATFSDDFTGAAGSQPDTTKWAWQTGPGAQIGGNNETELYVNDRATSYVDGNSNLVIAAVAAGTAIHSARMTSIFQGGFGTWGARIAVPNVAGCWPAWWFLGPGRWPGCGECDVMENYGTGFTDGTVWNSAANGNVNGVAQHQMDGAFHLYEAVHAFGSITLKIDGNVYCTATSNTLNPWPFDNSNGQWYNIINIATNGTGTGGVNPVLALLPCKMLLDYVYFVPAS